MVQYIYFVKCPNCEDEPFDFFDDAKAFALGCLGSKPIITQTEVCRNDFGECTDSKELGTVWSWEDMMQDIPADDSAVSVFNKEDLVDYDPDHDAEFDALDNSLDCVPDNFRKPIPAGMTIEALVEEMEENEDNVECVCCNELFPKEDCVHDEKHGWICPECQEEAVECTWCEELFDKSECRKEVDLGWLCGRCEAAIKSRGETLTFIENESFVRDPFDHHDPEYSEEEAADYTAYLIDRAKEASFDTAVGELSEALSNRNVIELEYHDLEAHMQYNHRMDHLSGPGYPDGGFDMPIFDEWEGTTEYTYEADADDVALYIAENLLTEEDVVEVSGGLEALENDDALYDSFMEANLDRLVAKYEKEILAYFRSYAEDDCQQEINRGNFTPTEFNDYIDDEDGRWLLW